MCSSWRWSSCWVRYGRPGGRTACCASGAGPQSLSCRANSARGFLNYGDKNYISYKRELDADKRFDPLGNFLLEGFRLLGYNEARPGRPFVVDVQRKDLSEIGSVQLKDTLWLSSFLELAIFQDSIAGWEARFTVGDDIRTRFTPLTLNLVRMTGMRFDVASPRHHKFTLVQWAGHE